MTELQQWRHNVWVELGGVDVTSFLLSAVLEDGTGKDGETDGFVFDLDDADRRFLTAGAAALEGQSVRLFSKTKQVVIFSGTVDTCSFAGKRGSGTVSIKCLVFKEEDILYSPRIQATEIYHTNVYASTIVSGILKNHLERYDVEAETCPVFFEEFKETLMVGETDWMFLTRFARRVGFEIFIKANPSTGRQTIIFREKKHRFSSGGDSRGGITLTSNSIIDYKIDDTIQLAGGVISADPDSVDQEDLKYLYDNSIYKTTWDYAMRKKREFVMIRGPLVDYGEEFGTRIGTVEIIPNTNIEFDMGYAKNFQSWCEMWTKGEFDTRTPRVGLNVMGNYKYMGGVSVAVSGLGAYSGIYYIEKAVHTWKRGGLYQTKLDLVDKLGDRELGDFLPDTLPDEDGEEGLFRRGWNWAKSAVGL